MPPIASWVVTSAPPPAPAAPSGYRRLGDFIKAYDVRGLVPDEVDAPLDDANVERFCDLLVRMTAETDTRYLIVTHNAVTMARMDRLYGVTMIERGVSRLVSVDLGGAERGHDEPRV